MAAGRRPDGPLPSRPSRSPSDRSRHGSEAGWLSLEAVMILPVVALLIVGVLQVAVVVRDVLVLHDAARVGARAAATSTGEATVRGAVEEATPEFDAGVVVRPLQRSEGDLVTVTVTTERQVGPVRHRLRASSVARVEPVVRGPSLPSATP